MVEYSTNINLAIKQYANALGKFINQLLTLPRPDTGNCKGRLDSLDLASQLIKKKKLSEFKPVLLRLKLDLVSDIRCQIAGGYHKCVQTNDYRQVYIKWNFEIYS